MTTQGKTIAIIIPTFNRKKFLSVLLEQIRAQRNQYGFQFIPVVVIDGSTDGTFEHLSKHFPEVKILQGPGNWWWTKSVNQGAKFANSSCSPDYMLILNDDSQIEPDYTDQLADALCQCQKETILGSISITDHPTPRVSFAGVKSINWVKFKKYNYFPPFTLLSQIPSNGFFPTYCLNGRGTLLSSKLFTQLNYLDEATFPQYGSDDDLALRAIKAGYDVKIAYAARVIDRTQETSKGAAFRNDGVGVFVKSFFRWNSVNYLPKQVAFYYRHGIKILIPFYILKFLLGTSNAYFFKYKKLRHEI